MGLPLPAPMLAILGAVPTGPEGAFEFKWDGVRAITRVEPAGAVVVKSRRRANSGTRAGGPGQTQATATGD